MPSPLKYEEMPPFDEAVNAFLAREVMTRDQFNVVAAEMRTRAYTIAGINSAEILQSTHNSITSAIKDGQTLEDFKKFADSTLFKSDWHQETVFRTNIQNAHGVGHWEQAQETKALRPYAMYTGISDNRIRETHAALVGMVFPIDHPFWSMYWPPWGYNCRCQPVTLSQYEVDAAGLQVSQLLPPDLPLPKGDFITPVRGLGTFHPDLSPFTTDIARAVSDDLLSHEIISKLPALAPVVPVAPEIKPKVHLSEYQLRTLEFADSVGGFNKDRMDYIIDMMKYEVKRDPRWNDIANEEWVKKLHAKVLEDTRAGNLDLTINRELARDSKSAQNILEEGRFKNQYETGTSKGYLGPEKGSGRDRWEGYLSNGEIQKNPEYTFIKDGDGLPVDLAKERPIYGYLNSEPAKQLNGTYGHVSFHLEKEVSSRSTFTLGNSSTHNQNDYLLNINGTLGRYNENNLGLIHNLILENNPKTLLGYTEGTVELHSLSAGVQHGYLETQIYGGVEIARDVKFITVNAPYYQRDFKEKEFMARWGKVVEIAKKYNKPIAILLDGNEDKILWSWAPEK